MRIIFPPYVLKRMIERNITVAEVRDVLENGAVIEEYLNNRSAAALSYAWMERRWAAPFGKA